MLQDPKFIRGEDINDTVVEALEYIMKHGKEIQTRNGSARFVNDLTLQIDNPQRRHLSLDGRKYNIYQLMAETFWVASGSGAISPFLEFFLPRAKNYSDDGETWHGAYGPRMLAHGQLEDLIATFRREGLSTRRAILMIADPALDNLTAIKEKYDSEAPRDIPCNREMVFYVVDNKLNAKVIQRSGDLIFGTGSINPFEFTFIQEMVYNMLLEDFPELELGVYRWHITNAHIYSDYYDQAKAIIHSPNNGTGYSLERNNYIPRSEGITVERGLQVEWLPGMMEEVVHEISEIVLHISKFNQFVQAADKGVIPESYVNQIKKLVEEALYNGNTLFDQYINLIVAYVVGKKFEVTLYLPTIEQSLLKSVDNCSFTNFNLVIGSLGVRLEITGEKK